MACNYFDGISDTTITMLEERVYHFVMESSILYEVRPQPSWDMGIHGVARANSVETPLLNNMALINDF